MPRRRAKVELTLFPFLNVLSGLIAVLILFMIIILSTRAMGTAAAASVGTSAAAAGAVEDGISAEEHDRLMGELDALYPELARRQAELADAVRVEKELRRVLARKQDEFVERKDAGGRKDARLGEPDPINMVPARGHEVKQTPLYIEVKADGFLVHLRPDAVTFPPLVSDGTGDAMKLRADPKFKAVLDRVDANRTKQYLILLIHPSGVKAFGDLGRFLRLTYPETVTIDGRKIEKSRIDVGFEPFSRDWKYVPKEGP